MENMENNIETMDNSVKRKEKSDGIRGWIKDISIAILVALLIMAFIKPTIVQDRSMQSTLYENNYILLSRQAYLISAPSVGDIIVFQSNLPNNDGNNKLLIKRVIAVAGDAVTISNGNVYINGELAYEPFLNGRATPGAIDNLQIPDGTVFVMGDNRSHSTDSRHDSVGFVPIDDIVGRAFVRLFPFNQIGLI
jgi:signal peptidase I